MADVERRVLGRRRRRPRHRRASSSCRRGARPTARRCSRCPRAIVDPGETPPQAAAREVREEAGVDAELVGALGDVRYWYMRGGRRIAKLVDFFLFAYVSGDVDDHDHEVEHARWMPLRGGGGDADL